jgi:hypothetical protein
MALIRKTNRRHASDQTRIPHFEQLALHATILAFALTGCLSGCSARRRHEW